MIQGEEGLLQRLRRIACFIEDGFLIGLLLFMILLASLQILLRNVFDTGLVWADELLRIQVLWVGLLGAVAASRDDNHINIDLLTRFLPPRFRLGVRIAVDLFTSSVCMLVAWHALRFVQLEFEFDSRLLGRWPAWIFQSIIPIGFVLIAYRYLLYGLVHLRRFCLKQEAS